MSMIAGFARGVWYFFVEDGAIVVGTIIALLLVGGLAALRPSGSVEAYLGPLLFLLISALLATNLLHVARQLRRRSR